jgi:hypothetical protein
MLRLLLKNIEEIDSPGTIVELNLSNSKNLSFGSGVSGV